MTDLFDELNKLDKADLINLLLTRNASGGAPNETTRQFFRELFPDGDGNESSKDRDDVSDLNKDEPLNESEGQCRSGDPDGGDKMGNETSPTETYTLSQIDLELKQFHRFAKENGLGDEEIAKICRPLIRSLRKPFLTMTRLRYGALLACIAVVFVRSFAYFEEDLSWHSSAIGRIFLMQLLPVWNWADLKNANCLVPYPERSSEATAVECTFCEFIDKIDATDNLDREIVNDKFLKLHRPIIIENAADSWKYVRREDLIETIAEDPVLSASFPCKLSTNTFLGTDKLYNVLKTIDRYDKYFVHFENCDFDAVKAFRKYFPRPDFLIPEISPVQYSWFLASNKYNVDKFKPVALREQITVVGQILGKNVFVLYPANDCADECKSLLVDLAAGEALILTSYWNLEYKPDPDGENVAVILEAHY